MLSSPVILNVGGSSAKRRYARRYRRAWMSRPMPFLISGSRNLFCLGFCVELVEALLNRIDFGLKVFSLTFQRLFFRHRIGLPERRP
jgi:hypothetical protein